MLVGFAVVVVMLLLRTREVALLLLVLVLFFEVFHLVLFSCLFEKLGVM